MANNFRISKEDFPQYLPTEEETKRKATEEKEQPEEEGKEKSLPSLTEKTSQLSSMETLLKEVTNRVTRRGRAGAFEDISETMGYEPSESGAGVLSGVSKFIRGQIGTGAKGMYESTIDLLDKQQQRVSDQIDTLITEDALPQFSDEQVKSMANTAGMDANFLLGIKRKQEGGGGGDGFGEPTPSQQSKILQNLYNNFSSDERKALYYWFTNLADKMTVDKASRLLSGEVEGAEEIIRSSAEKAGTVRDEDYIKFLQNNVAISSWILAQEGILGTRGSVGG